MYSWDEFVPADRLRKMNEENLRLQKELNENTKPSSNKPKPTPDSKKKMTSKAGSEDLPSGSSTTLPPRGQKRGRELEIEKVCGQCEIGSGKPANRRERRRTL